MKDRNVLILLTLIITPLALAQTITLISPNGGENWTAGNHHAIHWNWTGSISAVKIEYSTDGGASWNVIISSTTNDGGHPWEIPYAPATNCRVKVTDASNAGVFDMSDSDFTIARPVITVREPNGGEVWTVGEKRALHWDWEGDFDNVTLEYSTDGGGTWTVITSSTPNDGSYSWRAPNISSPNCKVKVSNTGDANSYDISDGNFTITTSLPSDTIKVISPKSGDSWIVGRKYYITWTTLGSISSVKLEYSTDGGSHWTLIIASASNDGNYEWTVPNTPSTNCKVKVSNAANPDAYDESEVFEIRQPGAIAEPAASHWHPSQPRVVILSNPVKSGIKVRFYLPAEAEVDLKILNSAGEVVKVLAQGRRKSGFYDVNCNMGEGAQFQPAQGVYFCHFRTGDFLFTEKMVMLR